MADLTREEIEQVRDSAKGGAVVAESLCRQLLAAMDREEHAACIIREMTKLGTISPATSERLLAALNAGKGQV